MLATTDYLHTKGHNSLRGIMLETQVESETIITKHAWNGIGDQPPTKGLTLRRDADILL